MRVFLTPLLISVIPVFAAPNINLPINAQVPPVAIVNQSYDFSFSDSTYTSTVGPIKYTLHDSPLWLELDSLSRTFHGTPDTNSIGDGGVGSFVAQLEASDDTGSTTTPITFVVTTDPGPGLGIPVAAQIPAFGAFSSPDILLLTPGSSLFFTFSPNTFSKTSASTVYYAKCANNTPLPSWINFDPASLSFSGITPHETSPSQLPQAFDIQLTASDVTGFAQAIVSFQLVVESHLFAFGNKLHIINTTIGSTVDFEGLKDDLTLDGQAARASDLSQVIADGPSWLSLSNTTLQFSGTTPSDARDKNFSVTAVDIHGDSASTVVLVQVGSNSSSALIAAPSTLNATIGTDFRYLLNTITVSGQRANTTVDPGTASAWLQYNSSSLEIYGHVPSNLKPQVAQIAITATQGSRSESQIVNISVVCGGGQCPNASGPNATPVSTTNVNKEDASGHPAGERKSWIAAAVIVPLAVIAGLIVVLCCRRRRSRHVFFEFRSQKTEKGDISRPIKGKYDNLEVPKITQRESAEQKERPSRLSRISRISERWGPGVDKRNSAFRLSISTTGGRQGARLDTRRSYIRRADASGRRHTMAAPESSLTSEECSSEDTVIYHPRPLFSANQISPSKRFSIQNKRSSQLPFSIRPINGFGHGGNGPSQASSSNFLGSKGVGHGDGSESAGPFGWGEVRKSWRNRGNLSIRSWTTTQSPADSKDPVIVEEKERDQDQRNLASILSTFPRPSTAATLDRFAKTHTIHEASDSEEADDAFGDMKPSTPRGGSVSQLRKKGAVNNNVPLFNFHRNRLRHGNSPNALFAANIALPPMSCVLVNRNSPELVEHADNNLEPTTPRKQTDSHAYSQSSSLEPPSGHPSPARTSRSVGSLRRNRSHINYNFAIRALSPLRRSRSSYASTTGSSKFSDPVGVNPFARDGALLEDSDDDGNRVWRHGRIPNPLRTNNTGAPRTMDVGDGELIDSLRASGQYSAAERLSYMKAQIERDGGAGEAGVATQIEVRSARGKKLGLSHSGAGKSSIKGDLGDARDGSAFV